MFWIRLKIMNMSAVRTWDGKNNLVTTMLITPAVPSCVPNLSTHPTQPPCIKSEEE